MVTEADWANKLPLLIQECLSPRSGAMGEGRYPELIPYKRGKKEELWILMRLQLGADKETIDQIMGEGFFHADDYLEAVNGDRS